MKNNGYFSEIITDDTKFRVHAKNGLVPSPCPSSSTLVVFSRAKNYKFLLKTTSVDDLLLAGNPRKCWHNSGNLDYSENIITGVEVFATSDNKHYW